MPNSVLRVLTALVGIPAVVGLLYLGGWPFAALVVVIALLAQNEVYELMEAGGLHPQRAVGLALGACFVLHFVYPPLLYVAAALVVTALLLYPFERRSLEGQPLGDVAAGVGSLAATLFGAVYPSLLIGFLLPVRGAGGALFDELDAFYLTLMVFIVVWATDTFAYYVGRAVGRHPLAPAVSPKKTREGAIGGVIGAVLVAVIMRLLVLDVLPWIHVAAVAVVASAAGQLGDLAESKLKRQAGVKDSGTILPGHGGMLDRFDALIVVAPSVYLYLRFVAGILY